MGYYMDQRGYNFIILAKNKEAALNAIKALADYPDKMSGGQYKGGKTEEKWYSWVSTEDFVNAKTLQEAMEAWGWGLQEERGGDVIGINFNGEKLLDDAILFAAIAPFVQDGSYIHMEGEDGFIWRWLFKDGQMEEQSGRVVFDEE